MFVRRGSGPGRLAVAGYSLFPIPYSLFPAVPTFPHPPATNLRKREAPLAPDPVSVVDTPEPALRDVSAPTRDPRAFEALYREHYSHVYAVTLRMTCDGTRAEDLTQEVFVRVWEKLPTFRGESALGTWIHTVAVRTTLEHLRAESRREARVVCTDEPGRYAAEARRAMPETAVDLERALATLPPGARSVLLLHDVTGYRYHEIANLLGVSLGTVKSQLNRARRLMMEALER